MQFKSIPWWLWLIPIVVLFVATERMLYGYYTFTRISVCGFAAFFAFLAWRGGIALRVWSAIFGLVAILFNPFLPIYLSRKVWYDLDVGVALIFAAHLALGKATPRNNCFILMLRIGVARWCNSILDGMRRLSC